MGMDINKFMEVMNQDGITSQKEMADALKQLIDEHDKLEEEIDCSLAGISAQVEDLQRDLNETNNMVNDLAKEAAER